MSAIKGFSKAGNEILDYVIDWSAWLNGDVINTSGWVAATGLTVASDSNTTTTATVWLSGGTINNQYLVTNTIATTGGRTAVRSILITCEVR